MEKTSTVSLAVTITAMAAPVNARVKNLSTTWAMKKPIWGGLEASRLTPRAELFPFATSSDSIERPWQQETKQTISEVAGGLTGFATIRIYIKKKSKYGGD